MFVGRWWCVALCGLIRLRVRMAYGGVWCSVGSVALGMSAEQAEVSSKLSGTGIGTAQLRSASGIRKASTAVKREAGRKMTWIRNKVWWHHHDGGPNSLIPHSGRGACISGRRTDRTSNRGPLRCFFPSLSCPFMMQCVAVRSSTPRPGTGNNQVGPRRSGGRWLISIRAVMIRREKS